MKTLTVLVMLLLPLAAEAQHFPLGSGGGTGTGDMTAASVADSVAAVLLRGVTIGTPTKFTLGSDATGDIFYRAASTGYFTRLAIGTGANNRLAVSSGLPAWIPSDTVGHAAAMALKQNAASLADSMRAHGNGTAAGTRGNLATWEGADTLGSHLFPVMIFFEFDSSFLSHYGTTGWGGPQYNGPPHPVVP
jgi:hypothetical protein